MRRYCLLITILPLAVIGARAQRTMDVTFHRSTCDYCQMLFQEKQFGGVVETKADSVLNFDATECLVAFLISKTIPSWEIKRIWSVDFARPPLLVKATKATYLRSDKIESPMEVNLAAFGSRAEADSARRVLGGELLDWAGVMTLIKNRWYPER